MTGPTAYKRLSDARARLWPRVEVGSGRCFTAQIGRGSASSTTISVVTLTPFPCRAHGGREAPRDGEPPGGRMSVGAIVTLNRFTELTTGTHVTGRRRAFDVRSRVTINFLKDSHDLACRSWRLSRQGWVESRRRGVDQTLQYPSS